MKRCSPICSPVGIVYIVAKYVKTPAGVCSMIQESTTDFGSSSNKCYFGHEVLKDFLRYVDYLDHKYTDLGYKVHRVCNISISR